MGGLSRRGGWVGGWVGSKTPTQGGVLEAWVVRGGPLPLLHFLPTSRANQPFLAPPPFAIAHTTATRPQLRFALSGTNGDRRGREASGWRVEDPKQTMGTQRTQLEGTVEQSPESGFVS